MRAIPSMAKHLAANSRFQPLAKRNFVRGHNHSTFLRAFFAVGFLIGGGGFVLQIAGIETSHAAVATASSILSQTILAGLYLMATILFLNSGRAEIILKRTWLVLVLPILAIASALWSPDPSLTLRRSIALLGTVLFGLSLASRFTFDTGLRLIIRSLSASMLLSVILALLFPTQGVHQLTDSYPFQPEHAGFWRGIYAHKNILGGLSGLTTGLLLVYGASPSVVWPFGTAHSL